MGCLPFLNATTALQQVRDHLLYRPAGPMPGGEPVANRRVLIIRNPAAGRRQGARDIDRLALALRRASWQVDVAVTTGRGHATALAGQAVAAGTGVVLAAGGDGTVNEVIQPLVGSPTALAVLPVGTVNLWAAETAISAEPPALAELLDRGLCRRVDVGSANGRYFLLMAGLGFDAAVVRGVELPLKRLIGRWSYIVAAAELARHYTGTPVRLALDGLTVTCTVLLIVVGNTRRYAGPLRATPAALVDDGRLDVCIVRGDHVWDGLPQAGAMLVDLQPLRRRVMRGRASRIEVGGEVAVPLQLDGEFAGFSPATIEAVPRALRVIVGDRPGGLFGG